MCKERIIKNGLGENVSCQLIEIDNLDFSCKYDYILYSGSYPVIPSHRIDAMIIKSKELLKNHPSSRIIFSHGLCVENKESNKITVKLLDLIKRNIKYIPFIWTDFGKITTVKEFESLLKKHNLEIKDKIEMELALNNNGFMEKYILQAIGATFKSNHYIYSLSIT